MKKMERKQMNPNSLLFRTSRGEDEEDEDEDEDENDDNERVSQQETASVPPIATGISLPSRADHMPSTYLHRFCDKQTYVSVLLEVSQKPQTFTQPRGWTGARPPP